jgi:hypothetical protein
MKKKPWSLFSGIVLLLLLVSNLLFGQVPDFKNVPNIYPGDSMNIMHLINNGRKIIKEKVICWFPKDSLSETEMNEIANTINTGINASEQYIKAPLPWQAHNYKTPITFYFRLDTIISHASLADFVSISFWRIKHGKSPWLHEALHEILQSKGKSWYSNSVSKEYVTNNMPLWLYEGLLDYISEQISKAYNLPRFDVFSNTYLLNTDSLFLEDMKAQKDSHIISYIGSKGVLPELSSNDRMRYAPAFFHGSCSFVKYIVDNYGIEVLFSAISSFENEHQTIENLCGRSLAILKKDWLEKIKVSK